MPLKNPSVILDLGLGELGIPHRDGARQHWLDLAELLVSWGQRINLSGHRSAADVISRLVLDALAMSRCLPEPFDSLVDLGSGAGFPGLPIAILRPETRVVLVESRERRHHFQRAAIRTLGLQNVHAVRGRMEELEPEQASIVIAQAVLPAAQLISLIVPWAESGGAVVIPGSEQAPDPAAHPQILSKEIRHYQVPCDGPRRTLWIGRRR